MSPKKLWRKERGILTAFNEMFLRQTLKPLLQGLLVFTELFSHERCNISVIQDRSPVNTRDAKWPNISVIPQKFCLIQCIRNRNWMHQLNSVTTWQVLIKPVKNQSCSRPCLVRKRKIFRCHIGCFMEYRKGFSDTN
jgi:hypothetical protein